MPSLPPLPLTAVAAACRPTLAAQAVDAEPSAEALAGRAAVHNKLKNHLEAAADASRATELDERLAAAHKEKG